jgi:Family of unknown function (DUF6084)
MSVVGQPSPARSPEIPEPAFTVERAEAAAYAAAPTLVFVVGVEESHFPVRSILLDVQIQIAARRRGYDPAEEVLLEELFGTPDRWRTTLRTLPWARTTVIVPPFEGSASVEMAVPLSYDLEVASARYLSALADGGVPLEFLFSGSVFFTAPQGALQTTRIGSDCEATFVLPVAVWREAIDRHFPNSAWLRLGRDSFQALSAYKARHAFATWDEAVDALLERGR